MTQPFFLLALWRSTDPGEELQALVDQLPDQLGIGIVSVEPLEGDPSHAVLLTRWPDADTAQSHADALGKMANPPDEAWLAPALPDEGVAGAPFPTRADIAEPAGDQPAYMLVLGQVSDREKLGAYSALIWPMYRQRGGYYLGLATADNVRSAINDNRDAPSIVIARWPNLAAARDFWFSDDYQSKAIPLRADAGTFNALLLSA